MLDKNSPISNPISFMFTDMSQCCLGCVCCGPIVFGQSSPRVWGLFMCIVFYRNLIHNVDTIPDKLLEPLTLALSFSFIQFGLMDFNSAQYIPYLLFVPLQFGVCLDSFVWGFLGYDIKIRYTRINQCFINEKHYSSCFINMVNWVACYWYIQNVQLGETHMYFWQSTYHFQLDMK